ncbi:hypothetical protein MLD38_005630 [Melastoma candidum]|uniref:Uncharacterized protein n=1 Tax=Melastoma candidum TaxID=119954 RepID=A0ACB9RM75_9MYRT|nr:hypothetical protein MLD38_005630 [Melastoma candidum]
MLSMKHVCFTLLGDTIAFAFYVKIISLLQRIYLPSTALPFCRPLLITSIVPIVLDQPTCTQTDGTCIGMNPGGVSESTSTTYLSHFLRDHPSLAYLLLHCQVLGRHSSKGHEGGLGRNTLDGTWVVSRVILFRGICASLKTYMGKA